MAGTFDFSDVVQEASDRLPTLLGSRPKAAAEDLDQLEKKGGRRSAPAPLEIAVEDARVDEEEEEHFCVKNTFIQGSVFRSPSLERFYRERNVHTCPGKHVGRLVEFGKDASPWTAGEPMATPRLRSAQGFVEGLTTPCMHSDLHMNLLLSPSGGYPMQTPLTDASCRQSLFNNFQPVQESPIRPCALQSTPPPPTVPPTAQTPVTSGTSPVPAKSTLSASAPAFEMPSASQRVLPPVTHHAACLGTEAYMPGLRMPTFEPPAGARRPVLSLSAALDEGMVPIHAAPHYAAPSTQAPYVAEYSQPPPPPQQAPAAQSLAARGARTIAALLRQPPAAAPASPAPTKAQPTATSPPPPVVPASPPRAVDTLPTTPTAMTPTLTAAELQSLPSVGSASHGTGHCRPCAFLHTKGCENGHNCQFCHLCGPDERKRRRKEKVAAARVRRVI